MIKFTFAIRLVAVTIIFLASAGAQTGSWTPPVAVSTNAIPNRKYRLTKYSRDINAVHCKAALPGLR